MRAAMSNSEESGPMDDKGYRVLVHNDDDGSLWAEVPDLPGVFASGRNMDELFEATVEAITLVMLDGPADVEVTSEGRNYTVTAEGPDLAMSEDGQAIMDALTPPAPVVALGSRRKTKVAPHRYSVREVDILIEA